MSFGKYNIEEAEQPEKRKLVEEMCLMEKVGGRGSVRHKLEEHMSVVQNTAG